MEFSDYELSEMLKDALDDGMFDRAAYGIALQAHDKGTSSLSPKQLSIYDNVVRPALSQLAQKREREDQLHRWRD